MKRVEVLIPAIIGKRNDKFGDERCYFAYSDKVLIHFGKTVVRFSDTVEEARIEPERL